MEAQQPLDRSMICQETHGRDDDEGPEIPLRLVLGGGDGCRLATPEPAETLTVTSPGDGYTAILRVWGPGDVALCRMCPVGRCVAVGDLCLLMVRGRVDPDAAAVFDATGKRWPAVR